jgi:hypothetical protein
MYADLLRVSLTEMSLEACRDGQIEIFRYCHDQQIQVTRDHLYLATQCGQHNQMTPNGAPWLQPGGSVEILRLLLDLFPDLLPRQVVVRRALYFDRLEIVQAFLDEATDDIQDLFELACRNGTLHIVEYLLAFKPNVEEEIVIAASEDRFEVVRYLLDNCTLTDRTKRKLLTCCVTGPYYSEDVEHTVELCKILLDRFPYSQQFLAETGLRAFQYYRSEVGQLFVDRQLMKKVSEETRGEQVRNFFRRITKIFS